MPLPPMTQLPADDDLNHPPEYMEPPERNRFRRAAMKATRLYPGPVGKVLRKEILAWEEYGWRLGNGDVADLIDFILEEGEAAA